MANRKQSGFDVVASMPWPVGIVLGLIAYIAMRYGIGWYFGMTNNPFTSALSKLAATGVYAPIGWMALAGFWIAAVASFIGRRSRRQLLDKQTGIDSLRQMSWRQFELLAGEAFRRQGYVVEETGLGGADGGIDLILRKNGLITLVQCKQWQKSQVGVKIVREMYGLLVHHEAAAVKIVALGDYTPDAQRFAQDKPIELIHGSALIATVRSLQTKEKRIRGSLYSSLALSGSMVAALLVIGVLSSTTAETPTQVIPQTALIQPVIQPMQMPTHRVATTLPQHPQATIYSSDSQDAEQLREWKKRNAESMKILEKTAKELPHL